MIGTVVFHGNIKYFVKNCLILKKEKKKLIKRELLLRVLQNR